MSEGKIISRRLLERGERTSGKLGNYQETDTDIEVK